MDRKYFLTDAQWNIISPLFPICEQGKGFSQVISNRDAFEAVLYRGRTSCPWRDLPQEYGSWNTIYRRFSRWCDTGVFLKVLDYLVEETDTDVSHLKLDSTVCRAHKHAAGARKCEGDQAIGRSKGGLSTKIHAACATEVTPISLTLTGGQESDCKVGEAIIERQLITMPEVESISADRAYDSNKIREVIEMANKEAVIPPKKTEKKSSPMIKRSIEREKMRKDTLDVLKNFEPSQPATISSLAGI
jgi:transposase